MLVFIGAALAFQGKKKKKLPKKHQVITRALLKQGCEVTRWKPVLPVMRWKFSNSKGNVHKTGGVQSCITIRAIESHTRCQGVGTADFAGDSAI